MKFQAGFNPNEARTLLSICTSPSHPVDPVEQPIHRLELKNWERITLASSEESNISFELGKSPCQAYYLIFRGEDYSIQNVQKDLEINISHASGYAHHPNARVQRSFRNEFESLLPELLKWIEIISVHAPIKLFVVGHGRGAAIATLCAAWLHVQDGFAGNIRVKAYLFGSPRVGNTFFVDEMNEMHGAKQWCFNVRHSRDLIPFIPLAPLMNSRQPMPLFSYKDVGELVLLEGEINLHGTTLTGTFSRHRAHWYAHYLKQHIRSTKGLGFRD